MAALPEFEAFAWPASRLGEAMDALARCCGLSSRAAEALHARVSPATDLGPWIESAAKHLGCDADPIEANYRDLESDLASAYPAVLRVSDNLFLALASAGRARLRVLTPNLRVVSISIADVCQILREPLERGARADYDRLLEQADLPASRRASTISLLLREQLSNRPFRECWILRPSPGADPLRALRTVGAVRNACGLFAAHTAQYLLWIASWIILGRLSLAGRMDRGWLLAWAMLLITLVPFRLLTTWKQGLLAIGAGAFLKRRLLYGALRLGPEQMRHCGIGSFLAQVFESEIVETLALSGGIAGLLAIIELAVSAVILGRFAVLLLLWSAVTLVCGWLFLRRYQRWTGTRLSMTQDLTESMVGHRTRLAQLPRERWHESEDEALGEYFRVSRALDGTGTVLIAALPRGWLIAALACLAPAVVAGHTSATQTAVVLGGILLAFTAFTRLTGSFAEIAAAIVAWKRVSPLFRAAAQREDLSQLLSATPPAGAQQEALIDADRLTFRYRKDGNPALQGCSLTVRRCDRILLEGPSGGGKTTLASLLSGMRQPESGLLLVGGFDRHTLGTDAWRKRVAAAPQFHENHILTETLAFNLLMGRGWPPTAADMEEAESLCRELGLGPLLDTMPSGILQMVGEGGWQLSHGERSRIFIARALLQRADLIILDESFAALDPENLRTALECTLRRADTLMVIAHP
jgi:ATP-binding cassette, subfamily B, bacterial